MKRSMLLSSLTLVLLALPLLAMAGAPLAVLMSVTGEVSVVKAGGGTIAGSFGAALGAGDEIRTGPNSTAEILFDGGNLIQIGANSSTVIKALKTTGSSAPSVDGVQTAALNEKSFGQVQNFLKLKDAQGTSSLAGLRSVDKENQLEALMPVQTKIRDERPVFEWRAGDEAGEVQIKLYNDQGEVWSHTTGSGHSATYPADAPALKAEVAYSWTVETTDPLLFPPLRSQAAFFEVMSSQDSQDVADRLAEITPDESQSESTYHVVRASLFFSYGLMDDAIRETIAALQTDADNPTLQAILARLYAEVGRNSDALGEYNELLDSK